MLPVPWQLEPVAHVVCTIGFTSVKKDFATLLQSIEPPLLLSFFAVESTDLLHANKTTATIRAAKIFFESPDLCFSFFSILVDLIFFAVINTYLHR